MRGFVSAAEMFAQLRAFGDDGNDSASQATRAYELAHRMAPPSGSVARPLARAHLIYNPNGPPANEAPPHLWILVELDLVPPRWLQHMREAGSGDARVSLGISVFERHLAQLAAGAPVEAMVELMQPQEHGSRTKRQGGKRHVRLCEATVVTASTDPEDAVHLYLRLQPLAGALGFTQGPAFGLRLLWRRMRPLIPKNDCMPRGGRYGPVVRYVDNRSTCHGYKVQFEGCTLSVQTLCGLS